MKKTKVIIPAMGLLLLSTAASISGTVAWFAVNTSVTVTGLQVRAKAEGGIVIAPYTITPTSINQVAGPNELTAFDAELPDDEDFKNTASNSLGTAELYPTSTSTATAWYHATSNDVNNHAAASAYSTLSLTTDGKSISGSGTAEAPYVDEGQYFLYNKYRVKSTTANDNFGLYIRSITVTAPATQNTAALNDSLRIAIKAGTGSTKFYAPRYDAAPAGGLKWYNGSAVAASTAVIGHEYTTNNMLTANASEVVKAGIDVEIWVYYEGEDTNLKTINADAVTIDELSIQFSFAVMTWKLKTK